MATRRVKLRGRPRDVVRKIAGSMGRKHTTARRVFTAHVARAFFEGNLKEFDKKSRGGTDSEGERWLPLSPQTIAKKLTFSRAKQKKFNDLVDRLARQAAIGTGLTLRQARQVAIRSAQVNFGANPAVLILVDTHDLRNSLRPGWAGKSGYVRRPKQAFSMRGSNQFVFGTTVEYAKHVAKNRRFFVGPGLAAKFVRRGIVNSLPEVLELTSE